LNLLKLGSKGVRHLLDESGGVSDDFFTKPMICVIVTLDKIPGEFSAGAGMPEPVRSIFDHEIWCDKEARTDSRLHVFLESKMHAEAKE
jgi:hypothetical protein